MSTEIIELEGVQIRPANKITKGRLTRFEQGQKEVAIKAGIPPIKPGKTEEENKAEAERFQKAILGDLESSLEVMAVTTACFCDFTRNGVKMSYEEVVQFIDEEVDFDDLEKIATLGATKVEEFQKSKVAKKKPIES